MKSDSQEIQEVEKPSVSIGSRFENIAERIRTGRPPFPENIQTAWSLENIYSYIRSGAI